jgi:hypothetical protein
VRPRRRPNAFHTAEPAAKAGREGSAGAPCGNPALELDSQGGNMKRFLLAAAIVALTACATTTKYEAKLQSWNGASVDSLVASWGYPSNQFVAPNGNTVYVYERTGGFVMPTTTTTNATVTGYGNYAQGTATTTSYGGGVISMNCKTFFEAKSDKTIVSWRWEGNACKSR